MRLLTFAVAALALAGCQTLDQGGLADRPKVVVDDGQPAPFPELLNRARAQALATTDAFHVDNWQAVEGGATGLTSTARLLGQATDVPTERKGNLATLSATLSQAAEQLKTAAQAKDASKVNDLLARINLQVRQLKP